MNDAEAAARAIIDILATGDLDAVSSAVAEEHIDHQGLGDVEAALRLGWHGINRAGRTVTRGTLDLLRFADGRLIEHWGAELRLRGR